MAEEPPYYVPRIAAESVLVRLEEHVADGGPLALLVGPPGIGKSTLLKVLAARLEGSRRCVHVPHASFGPDEVSAWILDLAGETAGDDPDAELAEFARRLRAAGSGLALLVDEADSLPPDTARRLSALVSDVHPAASLVLAGVPDAGLAALRAALGRELLLVRFDEPMSRDECADFVRALQARDPRAERRDEVLDDAALDRLFLDSGGVAAALEGLLERRAWTAPAGRAPTA